MATNSKLSDHWVNIILLAIAIFFANLWLKHHLSDRSQLIVIVNALIAIYGVAYSIIGKTFGEEGQKEVGSWIERVFWILLKPGFLVSLYLVILLSASLYASVWLVNNGLRGSVAIELSPMDTESRNKKLLQFTQQNEILKKGYFTSPFGRIMSIRAKGYRDHNFVLYPFVGKKIMLNDVMIPLPSIWVRSYPTIVNILLDDCHLAILSKSGKDTLFIQPTQNTVGSYIIGEPQSVTSFQIESWQREASAYYRNEGPDLSNTLLKWNRTKYFDEKLDLEINKEYQAMLISNDDLSVLGKADFIVNKKDLLIDVLLQQP